MHPTLRLSRSLYATLILAALAAACSGDDTPVSPTAPTAITDGTAGGVATSDSTAAGTVWGTSGGPSTNAPGNVTNLAGIQRTGQNIVDLTWNPPTTGGEPTQYYVLRESYDSQTVNHSNCTTQSGTTRCTATFSGLSHDPHHFTVQAQNNSGTSPGVTIQVSVTAHTVSLPGPVGTLAGTQTAGTTDVVLRWTAAEAVVDYYATTGPASSALNVQPDTCTATACSVTYEAVGTGAHTFTAAAVNSAGTGTSSSIQVTVTETIAGPPATPTEFTATQVGFSNKATLTWNPVEGATSYTASYTSGMRTVTVNTSDCSTTCSATMDSFTFGTYTFTVSATNTAGSSASATASLRLIAEFTAVASNIPLRHGNRNFRFRVTFSENFDVGFRKMRDYAFNVSGGRVRRARRVDRQSNIQWTIHVRPTNGQTTTLTLQKPSSCHNTALCSRNNQPQSADVVVTVVP